MMLNPVLIIFSYDECLVFLLFKLILLRIKGTDKRTESETERPQWKKKRLADDFVSFGSLSRVPTGPSTPTLKKTPYQAGQRRDRAREKGWALSIQPTSPPYVKNKTKKKKKSCGCSPSQKKSPDTSPSSLIPKFFNRWLIYVSRRTLSSKRRRHRRRGWHRENCLRGCS